MCTFTCLSFVGFLCLYSFLFNFVNGTPQTAPTLPPTTPISRNTESTTRHTTNQTQITTTRRITTTPKITCQPSQVVFIISDDKPPGHKEKISISCNNWGNKNVSFHLEMAFDEDRYFAVQYFQRYNYLQVTVKNTLKTNYNRPTHLTVKEEPFRNVTLNRIPFYINVIEMNDPPSIFPSELKTSVPEDVAVGSIIGSLNFSDPDMGEWEEWRELEVYSQDIPEELRIDRLANGTILLKTNKTLDADKYRNYSQINSTMGFLVEQADEGPIIHFTIEVKDKPGLTSAAIVSLTIIDIADENPVCTEQTVMIKTHVKKIGDLITSLYGICDVGNYVKRGLSYSLLHDNCTAFSVVPDGFVTVRNKIPDNTRFCLLTVEAADGAVPTLTANFTIGIILRFCPSDTDYRNIKWEVGMPRNYTVHRCPPGSNGRVTRYCNENEEYQDPVYNCTSSVIADIHKKLKRDGDSANVIEVLDTLAAATSESSRNDTLLIGDMNTINSTLSIITDLITVNTTNVDHVTYSFMETANNILELKTTPTWKVMINQTGSGAETVLENIDRFVEKIVSTRNTTIAVPKSNLYLKIGSIKACEKAISFPDRGSDSVSEWAQTTQDQIVIGCGDETVKSYSGVMYRNLSQIIPSTTIDNRSTGVQLNAPVMSFTYFPSIKRQLDSPVEITFQLYNNHWEHARCSFWEETNGSQGFWSEEGCQQKEDDQNKGTVVCVCEHLTNFAVLMSPSSPSKVPEDHATALSIISMTGCIISMICLFLTAALHIYFWRVVKSVRSILHINLSCSLFIAYILFLSGINRTEHKDVCTAMAVLLHLVFLTVFFIMLTEGINLAYIAIKPLNTRKPYTQQPGIHLLIASYVLAVIIVAVSMGVTKLEGYGTENKCWLSTETGLIWAFIVPVLVIIALNVIIVAIVIWVMCGTAAISRKSSMGRLKTALRSILILTPIMGLTWVFGAFSINEDTLIFQYLFAIFNSLQIRATLRRKRPKWLSSDSTGASSSERQKMKTQDTTDL
ncbi:adhesion G protein-coupled receptor L3-like isoform X2 [Mercenaria mercenaria]|uniref:adhesion G protein-coupled receptor L3-like isoform X2 n=1 Tax=Mercenaria mercenaria TaxID=6596 RepID=UPI00234F4195|nr:adhesion G protein-coupled receptor L3-like isoform X2 [Mercenaria mercenaria]